jgi:hypothetical protein
MDSRDPRWLVWSDMLCQAILVAMLLLPIAAALWYFAR